MDKVINLIERMVAVEEAAQRCSNCAPGVFCVKHDEAFWHFWGEVKRHLTSPPTKTAQTCPHTIADKDDIMCPQCLKRIRMRRAKNSLDVS